MLDRLLAGSSRDGHLLIKVTEYNKNVITLEAKDPQCER